MARSLLPNIKDLKVLGRMMTEGHIAFGYKAWMVNPVEVKVPDIGFNYDYAYDENHKTLTSVIFDPHPSPRLIQRLGWVLDQESSLLVSIPRYLPQSMVETSDITEVPDEILPVRYSRLTIEYDYYDFGRDFIVTEVTAPMFNPVVYYAKVAPYIIRSASTIDKVENQTADNNVGRFLRLDEVNPEYDTVSTQFRFIKGLSPRSSDRNGIL